MIKFFNFLLKALFILWRHRKLCTKTSRNLCQNQSFLTRGHLYQNLLFLFRSGHRRCSLKIGVLQNFAKFTGKRLSQSNSVSLGPANLFKKAGSDADAFLWILRNFYGHLFLLNTSEWLLLTFTIWWSTFD